MNNEENIGTVNSAPEPASEPTSSTSSDGSVGIDLGTGSSLIEELVLLSVSATNDYAGCTTEKATCDENLIQTTNSLTDCTNQSITDQSTITDLNSTLTQANTDLETANTDLSTCNDNYQTCSNDLTTCTQDKQTVQSQVDEQSAVSSQFIIQKLDEAGMYCPYGYKASLVQNATGTIEWPAFFIKQDLREFVIWALFINGSSDNRCFNVTTDTEGVQHFSAVENVNVVCKYSNLLYGLIALSSGETSAGSSAIPEDALLKYVGYDDQAKTFVYQEPIYDQMKSMGTIQFPFGSDDSFHDMMFDLYGAIFCESADPVSEGGNV